MIEQRTYRNLTYLISIPDDSQPDRKYPVLFHTHGAGGRGTDPALLYRSGPMSEIKKENPAFRNCIVVAPQCFANTWFDIFEQLTDFCINIHSQPWVDRSRFYASGISMGGYAILQLMMSCPSLFAAGVVCCGGGMYWNAQRLRKIPLWLFHGESDRTVYPEESRRFYEKLKASDADVRLTIYPDTAHNCWDATYADVQLYQWLFSKRKDTEET